MTFFLTYLLSEKIYTRNMILITSVVNWRIYGSIFDKERILFLSWNNFPLSIISPGKPIQPNYPSFRFPVMPVMVLQVNHMLVPSPSPGLSPRHRKYKSTKKSTKNWSKGIESVSQTQSLSLQPNVVDLRYFKLRIMSD